VALTAGVAFGVMLGLLFAGRAVVGYGVGVLDTGPNSPLGA
jgi:hypothetical protein